MNRLTVTALAAVEALVTAAVGVLVCLTVFVMVWGFQYHLSASFVDIWRSALCAWFVGHGVDVRIVLDASSASSLGLPAAATQPFTIGIAILGVAMLTVLLGVRTGRRAGLTPFRWEALAVAIIVFAAVSTGLAFSAQSAAAAPVLWQAIVIPPFVLGVGLVAGCVSAGTNTVSSSRSESVQGSVAEDPSSRALAVRARMILMVAFRGATAASVIVVGVAAGLVAVLIFTRYATIIQLYEQLHTGVAGGVALTLAQLAFLPNIVIWAASWLVGPGFALGTGTAVSPLGTYVGPVPGLPLLGSIPVEGSPFALIGVVVPVLAGFVTGALMRQRSGFAEKGAPWWCFCALAIGAVSGLELGLLAWWSSGSLGPGRLVNVGPNPLLVGAIAAAEIGVSALIGVLAGGRGKIDSQ